MTDPFLNDNNVVNRLVREWREHGKLIIAYDYDNTVYDYHNKGYVFEDVIKLLRECKDYGAYLVVYSVSNEERYSEMESYLTNNDIPFDSINKQPDLLPFNGIKLYYNILLDDRAGLSSAYQNLKDALEIVKGSK